MAGFVGAVSEIIAALLETVVAKTFLVHTATGILSKPNLNIILGINN